MALVYSMATPGVLGGGGPARYSPSKDGQPERLKCVSFFRTTKSLRCPAPRQHEVIHFGGPLAATHRRVFGTRESPGGPGCVESGGPQNGSGPEVREVVRMHENTTVGALVCCWVEKCWCVEGTWRSPTRLVESQFPSRRLGAHRGPSTGIDATSLSSVGASAADLSRPDGGTRVSNLSRLTKFAVPGSVSPTMTRDWATPRSTAHDARDVDWSTSSPRMMANVALFTKANAA